MPAFESDAVEALREAARVLAVHDDSASVEVAGAPPSAQDVAELLDGLVVSLGHLGRGASMGRHPAPTQRSGECPVPRAWPASFGSSVGGKADG